jgi:ABC-2 type transport system permease protein
MTAYALRRPPLARLTSVELRKMADTRAGFWLLLVTGLIAAALVTIVVIWGEPQDQTFAGMFSDSIQLIALVLPVIGILLVTSEWSQRTGLTTFALVPERARVIVAKLGAATILTALAVIVCLIAAAVGNAVVGGSWDFSLGKLGGGFLFELSNMLIGVAFGLVFLNSALAIVLSFVIPIVWAILGEAVPFLDKPAEWLDTSRTLPTLVEESMSGGDWARLGTSLALWVGLTMAIGMWRLLRAELK